MKYRLAADVLKLVGKEIVIRRGMRYIPIRYLPYVRTAFVILDVVMIGRKIYLAIPRKPVPRMDQDGSLTETDRQKIHTPSFEKTGGLGETNSPLDHRQGR